MVLMSGDIYNNMEIEPWCDVWEDMCEKFANSKEYAVCKSGNEAGIKICGQLNSY